MGKKIIYLWFPAIFIFLLLASCRDNEVVNISDSNNASQNIPVVGNAPNAFSFVVDARSFDYSKTYDVQINSDTLSIAITVANYAAGSGGINITDENGNQIYSNNISGAQVSGEVRKLSTVPKNVTLNLSKFSGKVIIALAGKK